MNVSMMDSYNLSWKLAYSVLGLTPQIKPMLETYNIERLSVAQQLIYFDRNYSSMFCGNPRTTPGCDSDSNGTSCKFIETHRQANSFTSGCGVDYPESKLTQKLFHALHEDFSLSTGALKPGKRLPDIRLKRYADGSHCNLQDGNSALGPLYRSYVADYRIELPSNGRFRILCFTSTDLLEPTGKSVQALRHLSSAILPRFPSSTVEQLVIYPAPLSAFEWGHIPCGERGWSEMRFYNGYEVSDVYAIYGLNPAKGAVAVVRPDGYVGVVGMLTDLDRIFSYLRDCIVMIPPSPP
jgi:hypothetical protein